jgi:hypothetical protein
MSCEHADTYPAAPGTRVCRDCAMMLILVVRQPSVDVLECEWVEAP